MSNIPNNMKILQEYPYRSPLHLVDCVIDLIKDKTVCDIGCGAGDLLEYIKSYAKSVFGFERYDQFVKLAHTNGRSYIVEKDVSLFEKVPDADVYFIWTGDDLMNKIVEKIKPNSIIICGTSNKNPIVNPHCTFIEKRTYHFDEQTFCKKRVKNWLYEGERNIYILVTI
jgi:2-polyprenyl-3-methyl-5-hydroxy-6-metoxy-1,4-benzoquinol methylase